MSEDSNEARAPIDVCLDEVDKCNQVTFLERKINRRIFTVSRLAINKIGRSDAVFAGPKAEIVEETAFLL